VGAVIVAIGAAATSTAIAAWIGLWSWDLLKDAVVLTVFVVVPLTFRSISVRSGEELGRIVLVETAGLAAILTFYLDAAPLPLWGELLFQPAASVLVIMRTFAATQERFAPVRRLSDVLLTLMGVFLLGWTTVQLGIHPPIWSELFQELFFGLWLPFSLLPFFYLFGFYALTDQVAARFRALKRPFTPKLFLAFLVGTRLRTSLLSRFSGRYNRVAEATGFREGLAAMTMFREDIHRRDAEELRRRDSLRRNVGRAGVDREGLHFDRREFDVTKDRLEYISGVQGGQYEHLGNRYWDHLTDLMVDAKRHCLPEDHGFVVQVSPDGQVWRAWRQTPGGAVLGIGGTKHHGDYRFQGDQAPEDWPGTSKTWHSVNDMIPPDWAYNDGSRL
jgi:hypothetical protein